MTARAGPGSPGPARAHARRHGAISDHLPPGVQRVLARLGDVAVAVFAADWQLIWWNQGWAALLGDPSASPPRLRNFARDRFPMDESPARLALWPVTEADRDATDAAVVSDLRRATGRFPEDRRLAALIRELKAGNARFAELWATGGWPHTARTTRRSTTPR